MRTPREERLSGWGRISAPAREIRSEDLEAITKGAVLTRGLGRSYGDSSLPPASEPVAASSVLADRILAWNETTGLLRAEAGFTLAEMNRLFLPRGFFTPVSPGTQFVTLGGMIAADVHGKNHHRDGGFGEHVDRIRIRVASGDIVDCSREREPELFRATIGGMGLTGHILDADVTLRKVPSRWIFQESERIDDVERFVAALEEAAPKWPMTVGWIDALSAGKALGRGILMCGRWAEASEAPATPPRSKPRLSIPFVFPEWVLNRLSIRSFNELYYRRHTAGRATGLVHPDAFFYPLDALLDWNRLYGPRGFTQYQCVLPRSAGPEGARRFLELASTRGGASFLCVIKDCGAEGIGILSFPKPGISIALDLPVRDDTPSLVDALNERVLALGGRVYLAKDAFTKAEHFRAMEPRLDHFLTVRRRFDAAGRIRSAQSVRLFGDRP